MCIYYTRDIQLIGSISINTISHTHTNPANDRFGINDIDGGWVEKSCCCGCNMGRREISETELTCHFVALHVYTTHSVRYNEYMY